MSIQLAAVSYALAAATFLCISAFLLHPSRRSRTKSLAAASALTAAWAAAAACYGPAAPLTWILELARSTGWCVFLLSLLGAFASPGLLRKAALKILGTIAALVLAGYYFMRYGYPSEGSAVLILSAYLFLSVAGMLLVEKVFRNATEKGRWGIKFACLGIGGLFAFDFYMFSNALLFRQLSAEIWEARGFVNALTVPLIAISARRSANWDKGIAVSRRFLFNSVALLGASVYLLMIAAGGYFLRYFGGSWGAVVQSAFLFGAVLLLGSLAFSGAFRARLRVFLSKNFYTYSYDYREEWKRFTRTLAQGEHSLCEQAVRAIANLVESPGGALWIKRESGYCEPAGYWNMLSSTVAEPADTAFCKFIENQQWIIDIPAFNEDCSQYKDLALPDWLAGMPKAWLVVPLILHSRLFGFVVLASPRSRVQLNWEVLDLLKIAGSQAASYLAQSEAANALLVARQFDSYNRMSTFVVHDLKNLVAQLSLLLSNAEKYKDSPEFQQDMLDTVSYSVNKMNSLLQKFNRTRSPELPSAVSVDKLLRQVVDGKSSLRPRPTLQPMAAGLQVFANAARLERVISHFVLNAIEATPRDGEVVLSTVCVEDQVVIICRDSGLGMSAEFIRERLFQPFESTKSTGMGIGVFEAREYIHELGGRIDVESQVGGGTTFRIAIPLYVDSERLLAADA